MKSLGPHQSAPVRRPQLHPCYTVRVAATYLLTRGRRVVEMGRGEVVSFSAEELVFHSARPIASGLEIELTVPWPEPPQCPHVLQLSVKGQTRRNGKRTAIQIASIDFRTRSGTGAAGDALPNPFSKARGAVRPPRATPFAS